MQAAVDDGTADERLLLLKEVGEQRIALERARGGASLPMPEQEVDDAGRPLPRSASGPPLPAEDWNAQISLMTGMAAAEMMLQAQRRHPAHHARARRARTWRGSAGRPRALGVAWPEEQRYGEFLRSPRPRPTPQHLALIHEATALFRGAGYTPFDGDAARADRARRGRAARTPT